MARVKKKKKPLRGSIRQNTSRDAEHEGWLRWFGFWPRLALLVLGCIALLVLAGWLWRGQWPRQKRAELKEITLQATQEMGFAIKDLSVEGRKYTDKKELLDALRLSSGAPIFTFDPHGAYARIMKLPWTKSVVILRNLPNKIVVQLVERKPVARWQHDKKTIVIDAEGKELKAAKIDQFSHLPLIVGDVASTQTEELLSLLAGFPMISQSLKAAVRVAERRWNLHLRPDITVRLPEADVFDAMTRLTKLIKEQKITDRNVKAIDLRLAEKVFIEPIEMENGEDDK